MRIVSVQPAPALNGFAQQNLVSFELHPLDQGAYDDGRAFFLFEDAAPSAAMVAPGNECVQCHNEYAAFDGVITQFYPPVRRNRAE